MPYTHGKSPCRRLVSALCAFLTTSPWAGAAEDPSPRPPARVGFSVVERGRPAARVLVAEGDASRLAAALRDLTVYVERMSGARLEVVEGSHDLPGPTLHVGSTDHRKRIGDLLEDVRVDGFLLAAVGEDLVISGRSAAGTENGLITILQDHFGIRWYHDGPLWEVVPSRKDLAIHLRASTSAGAEVVNPSFTGRFYWGRPPSEAYRRRMRLTAPDTPLPYVGAGHSLDRVVPLDRYASTHPEYFALIGGRRVTDRVSEPCFTHPDMPRLFMDHVRAGGSSLGINDNLDACRCDRCLELDGDTSPYLGMPSVSESYFRLVAEVARRTAKQLPDRRLGVFAYQLTNLPPRTVAHIGENVDVVLCLDTSQHFDAEIRALDRRIAAEWTRRAGGVSLYDYCGISYWTPRYFPSLLTAQIRHFARSGGLGYMTHATTMIDSSMPMFALYCRMLWDVDLDARAFVDRMVDDLYEEAAPAIREFYAHWERCWLSQESGRWFRGMDDFRGEMTVYSIADIERGRKLLAEGRARARNDTVRERIDFLGSSFAFTRAAARAHAAYRLATGGAAPADPEAARQISREVVESWRQFARQLELSERIPGTSASGWHPKTFRVRAWALKQEMRDGVLAPLVRWAVSAEGSLDGGRLREIEQDLADLALSHREAIEELVTESIGAVRRPPRVAALRVADLPRIARPGGTRHANSGLTPLDAVSWHFRRHPGDFPPGKYDEPMPQHIIEPPDRDDFSVAARGGWDEQGFELRISVRDDNHVQEGEGNALRYGDSVLVTLNPERGRFDTYDEHSWYFLMGDYRHEAPGLLVGYRRGSLALHVVTPPRGIESPAARELLHAEATRKHGETVYALHIDWSWLPGFAPAPQGSFGCSIVVTDVDTPGGERLTAEYGDGIFPRRRPTEFAGLRLGEDTSSRP